MKGSSEERNGCGVTKMLEVVEATEGNYSGHDWQRAFLTMETESLSIMQPIDYVWTRLELGQLLHFCACFASELAEITLILTSVYSERLRLSPTLYHLT
jgi:hypothetical protein